MGRRMISQVHNQMKADRCTVSSRVWLPPLAELLEVAATKALEYADYLQDHQLREAIEMAYQMSVKRREEEEAAKLEGGPGSEYGGRESFFSDRVSIPGFSDMTRSM